MGLNKQGFSVLTFTPLGGKKKPKNFFKVLSSLLNLLLTEQLLVQVWL